MGLKALLTIGLLLLTASSGLFLWVRNHRKQ